MLRIGRLGFGTGRQKLVLETRHNAHTFRGVRVALGTGYNREEGNRREMKTRRSIRNLFRALWGCCTVCF